MTADRLDNNIREWQRKVDHRLRALWQRVPEADRARHRVRILLRFTGSGASFQEVGVQVHSVTGDIASATIVLADLARIANASQTVFVELAQPLAHDHE